jgi:hypothetical protein
MAALGQQGSSEIGRLTLPGTEAYNAGVLAVGVLGKGGRRMLRTTPRVRSTKPGLWGPAADLSAGA